MLCYLNTFTLDLSPDWEVLSFNTFKQKVTACHSALGSAH